MTSYLYDYFLTILLSRTTMTIAPFIFAASIMLLIAMRKKISSGKKAILISLSLLTTAYLLFIIWLAGMFG